MTIGERIKKRRQELGMTQETLGKLIGKSKAAVSSVEIGKERMTVSRVEKYARALSIDPAVLCGWK